MENVNAQMEVPLRKPSIYEHGDYRKFLGEAVAYTMKTQQLSLRKFVAKCSISSTTFLQNVIRGKKNILSMTAHRLSTALELNEFETRYFVHLVELNQAKTPEQTKKAHSQLLQVRRSLERITASNASILYFDLNASAIFELLKKDEGFDQAIARLTQSGFKESTILSMLNELASERLIEIQNERIYKSSHYLDLEMGNVSLQHLALHLQILDKQNLSLNDYVKNSGASHHSLVLCLSEEEAEELQSEIQAILKKAFLRKSHSAENPKNYYLSFHLTPQR